MIAADAAGGDDDCAGLYLELADEGAARLLAAFCSGRFEYLARYTGDYAAGLDQSARLMAELQRYPAGRDVLAHAALEHLDHARPGAPCQMEARHRIAVAVGQRAAALGPADDGPPAHAHPVQPRPHLAGGELDEGLGDPVRPEILGTVELRGTQPVLPGEVAAVADAEAALLGRVDHEEAAQRPPCLTAEEIAAFLLEDDDAPARIGELGRGDEASQPRADNDGVRLSAIRPPPGRTCFRRLCVEWSPGATALARTPRRARRCRAAVLAEGKQAASFPGRRLRRAAPDGRASCRALPAG